MNRRKNKLDPGGRIILLYILFAYVIPSIMVVLFDTLPVNYKVVSFNWMAFSILVLSYLLYFIFSNYVIFPRRRILVSYEFHYISSRLQFLIVASMVAVSLIGAWEGLNVFRYGDVSISERGMGLVLIYAMVPTLLNFHLMICVFYERNRFARRNFLRIIHDYLLMIGLFLSANGVATMLSAVFALGYAISPGFIRNIVYTNGVVDKNGLLLHRIIFTLFIFIVFVIAWIVGNSIKVGAGLDGGISLIPNEDFINWFTTWATDRIAPSWISLRIALDQYAFATDWNVIIDYFIEPVRTFLFRFNFILLNLFEVGKPENGSIMRINYLMVTQESVQADRQGTAPGLIAGFLFSFPFPLNFAVLVCYLCLLQWFLSRIVSGVSETLSFTGWCLLLYSLLAVFASPIDLLSMIDDAVIGFMLLIWLRQVLIKIKRRNIVQLEAN
uniref:hypothetical protein n=1 Tax=Polynucleobacter sp. TaxID=2029855 RepID=UPI0040474EC4